MYKSVPTYYNQTETWGETIFDTKEEFTLFIESLFKEPGQYQFDKDTLIFNAEATRFLKEKVYCKSPFKSKDFIAYWNDQKNKCRNGIIIVSANRKKKWYLPREYYMWLNFLQIYDKEKKKFAFPGVRDVQYHIALYELLAELKNKHVAILKKRQIASSYYHAAKIINYYWFEEGFISKMAASLKDYINEKGTWRFLEEYRNFLNTHTAWYRPSNPDKILNWEQKIEIRKGGKKVDKGLKSTILGYVLEKDPANGVGGPCGFFFHEEAGIAPKMSETIEYLLPSLKSGMVYTGQFAVAGSVGSLDQCDPLKNMILYPNSVDVLPVKTNLLNESGEERECGLFIPEQWSMPPYVDEYGNSQVEEALKAIIEERKSWREELNEKEYQLRISQKPTNIEEAFAIRGEPEFSTHLVNKQLRRIKEGLVPCRYVDLKRDSGKILCVPSKKRPIDTFPIKPGSTDKEGVIVIYEDPVENPSFGLYLASIDPVSEGRTTTSNSLCSIYIYKTPSEVYSVDENGAPTSTIEEGKIVASWCGRFDDLNKTHERLETLIEYYNAWTLIENNISLFIQYMFLKKKQRYLVPKSQVLFLKSLQANQNVYQEYGWKNVSTLFSNHLISYASAFVDEVIDTVTTSNGDIVKEIHGVERIPDPMLLQEMLAYKKGLNVDRLVAFSALVAFASVQVSNRGYVKRKEGDSKNLSNNQKNSNLKVSPFVNLGKKMYTDHSRIKKSPFKNIHR